MPSYSLHCVLTGCSARRSEPAASACRSRRPSRAQDNLTCGSGAWIAALVTGVVVWGLILGRSVRYRRRSDDEIPVQTRYNLPVEIFYTIFPIIMVVVFFSHTVRVQNTMLETTDEPDDTINVVGQQWQWTFNYPDVGTTADGTNVYVAGTGADIPTCAAGRQTRGSSSTGPT